MDISLWFPRLPFSPISTPFSSGRANAALWGHLSHPGHIPWGLPLSRVSPDLLVDPIIQVLAWRCSQWGESLANPILYPFDKSLKRKVFSPGEHLPYLLSHLLSHLWFLLTVETQDKSDYTNAIINVGTDLLSVRFSHSDMSSSLWPHGLQHARLPCHMELAQTHVH